MNDSTSQKPWPIRSVVLREIVAAVCLALLIGLALGVALAQPPAPAYAFPAPNTQPDSQVNAAAITYTVYYGGDAHYCNVNGCDLSGALDAANANPGADTIVFADFTFNIMLSSTLTISDDVTIDGSGGVVTINGNNSVQVMRVNSGKTLNLDAVTIASGHVFGDGGGIYVEGNGTLNVANSTFSGNSATGGWGGGIANQGKLTVMNVTFNNNSADGAGGGITNSGVLTVTNVTFSNNSAGGGGGIINSGVLTVTNSTFSGNSATFGSGMYNSGIMILYNTLVAANIGEDCYGTLTADSFNLDSDGSCDNATTTASINLGPLADNGGSTQTMALLAGSAAINAGDDTVCPATDQRGEARPVGAHCDVGAYEFMARIFLPLVIK